MRKYFGTVLGREVLWYRLEERVLWYRFEEKVLWYRSGKKLLWYRVVEIWKGGFWYKVGGGGGVLWSGVGGNYLDTDLGEK